MKVLTTHQDLRSLFVGERFRCFQCATVAEIETRDDIREDGAGLYDHVYAHATILCPNEECRALVDLWVKLPALSSYGSTNQYAGVDDGIEMSIPLRGGR